MPAEHIDHIDHVDYIANSFPTPDTDGRMTKGTRQQAPKNLRALHHEIIRLAVLGWKSVEIAKYLQITSVTVSNCLSSYKAKNILRILTQKRSEATVDLQRVMMDNAPVVHEVLLDAILDPDTPVATRAKEAREYLGICGFVKPQRIQSQNIHTHLTLDEINEIKARAKARAIESGLLVESVEEEVDSMNLEDSLIIEGELVDQTLESSNDPQCARREFTSEGG